jgi:hypothetical protein
VLSSLQIRLDQLQFRIRVIDNHDFAHKPFPLSFKKDSCCTQRIVIPTSLVHRYPRDGDNQ